MMGLRHTHFIELFLDLLLIHILEVVPVGILGIHQVYGRVEAAFKIALSAGRGKNQGQGKKGEAFFHDRLLLIEFLLHPLNRSLCCCFAIVYV